MQLHRRCVATCSCVVAGVDSDDGPPTGWYSAQPITARRMSVYHVALSWLLVLALLGAAAALVVTALRRPPPAPVPAPEPARWRARLPRHSAPARIRVIERTTPNLRRAAIEITKPPVRPGRHAREWIEQPTQIYPGMRELFRDQRL